MASLVAEHGLSSIQASAAVGRFQVLECSSVVEVHGLSRPAACGIFLDQGLNLCLLPRQAEALPEPPGKARNLHY